MANFHAKSGELKRNVNITNGGSSNHFYTYYRLQIIRETEQKIK